MEIDNIIKELKKPHGDCNISDISKALFDCIVELNDRVKKLEKPKTAKV